MINTTLCQRHKSRGGKVHGDQFNFFKQYFAQLFKMKLFDANKETRVDSDTGKLKTAKEL